MNSGIRTKLSIMMFLEYLIWGAWLPLLGVYLEKLGFSGSQSAWIFNAFAIAAVIGMFFGGQMADRYFAQEKFLAFSHLVGGLAMLGLAFVTDFRSFFALMMLHCFFYVPTMSITNSIALASLTDVQNDFGKIRLWGTIGWVVASTPLLFLPAGSARMIFFFAGFASLAFAAFSLTLPHTPPVKDKESSFAPLKAFKLLAIPSIFVLFLVTFLDGIVQYAHFFWTGRFLAHLGTPEKWIPAVMAIGQVSEVFAMAVLGVFLKKLGWRLTMVIGILGQALRFGVYSIGTPETLWLVIGVNILHGFAYACFFATVYIFVDESFPKDVRTSAQSLFNLNIVGISQLASNYMSGYLQDSGLFGPKESLNFSKLFLIPFGIGIVATIVLIIAFHPSRKPVPEEVAMEGIV